MIGKLARGLGILLLGIGLLGFVMGYLSIKQDREGAAQMAREISADPDMAQPFRISDLFDFEHMKESNRVLMQMSLTVLAAGAICFGLGAILKPKAPTPVELKPQPVPSPAPATEADPSGAPTGDSA